jgi:hypothetical protein
MHDRLFRGGGRLDSGSFKGYAKVIGLDQAAFAKCFDERHYLESIFQDRKEANRWGFHGTPGFILIRTVGGPTEKEPAIAIPGAFPFEEFSGEIDRRPAVTGGAHRASWVDGNGTEQSVHHSLRITYVCNTIVLVCSATRWRIALLGVHVVLVRSLLLQGADAGLSDVPRRFNL